MPEKDQSEEKVPFPAGFPKPHEAEEWARSMKSQFLAEGVAEVSQETIPEGKFSYLYPPTMLQPPPKLPKDAVWSETMKHRQMTDDIERRRVHNAHGSSGDNEVAVRMGRAYDISTDRLPRAAHPPLSRVRGVGIDRI
jgi:hypothetical protein